MPAIFISAVVSDGTSVLFEVDGEPLASATYSLPRFAFGDGEDSIEESLARQLREHAGIEANEQEFVDTLYERAPGSSEVRLNNLQMVTEWNGTPFDQTAGGSLLVWVPLEALGSLQLPGDLVDALSTAFGLVPSGGPMHQFGVASGRVIVITGPAGAGKSTVAEAIGGLLDRAALIQLDALTDMVRTGAPVPHWEGGDRQASYRHYSLAVSNAAALSRNFTAAGYDALVEGVFEQPSELDDFLQQLEGAEIYFVTLLPQVEEVGRRDQARSWDQQMGVRSRELHGIFSFNGEIRGLRIDSTGLMPDETARLILEQLGDARVQ
jgi:chloramphenicol 3-O-phosphotransferase